MAVYAIGDIQGCYEPLQRLLDVLRFDPAADTLWLVGDLVNRGPHSLATLRFVKSLGDSAITVLGNHDLSLLMSAEGFGKQSKGDTFDEILAAPDRDELLDWLRHQPLCHVEGQYCMVHAGLLPCWTVSQAEQLAHEAESALRQDNYQEFFSQMYGNEPNYWQDEWTGYTRLRVIINAMTRMRICTVTGKMNFAFKGDLRSIPPGYVPWFNVPQRASQKKTIICGHWSALGLHITDNLIALDTGCVWGGQLTAIRLEDRKVFQLPCAQ